MQILGKLYLVMACMTVMYSRTTIQKAFRVEREEIDDPSRRTEIVTTTVAEVEQKRYE